MIKDQLKSLFKALPLEGKILCVCAGVVPILVGIMGTLYSFCSHVFPAQLPLSAQNDSFPSYAVVYGLVMTTGCGIVGAFRLRKQRWQELLVQFGQRIDPPITKIEQSPIKEKNRRRYYICSNWQDPATSKT